MLAKELHIKSYVRKCHDIEKYILLTNRIGLLDVNKLAEYFVAGLLNRFFGISLVNANTESPQYPAVDLIDREKRIAVQVTSEKSSNKVQQTLNKFFDNKFELQYDELYVFMLKGRQEKYTIKSIDSFNFNPDKHIITFSSLVKNALEISLKQIQDIDVYMNEFDVINPGYIDYIKGRDAFAITDKEAFTIIRNFFDRPALQISIFYRSSFDNYYQALKDMTELVNTGKFNDIKGKSRHDFDNKDLGIQLDEIYMDLIKIRNTVENCIKIGGLSDRGFDTSGDMEHFTKINALQKRIAKRINIIAKQMGLKPLLLAF